jgi:hypothetical protein
MPFECCCARADCVCGGTQDVLGGLSRYGERQPSGMKDAKSCVLVLRKVDDARYRIGATIYVRNRDGK